MFEGGRDGVAGRVSVADVRALADATAELVGRLDPDDVLLFEATPLWQELARLERLAGAGATLLVRRVDEARSWAKGGFRNVDDYVAHHGGTSPSDAKRSREASERLRDLGDTSDAFRRGELSEEQARAISDAATANPDAEHKLLDDAKKQSLRDLQDQAKRAKAAADPDPDATHRRNHQARKVRCWVDAEQAFHLHANSSTLDGQPIKTAIDRITDDIFHANRTNRVRESRDAMTFDALRLLAEHYLNDTPTTSPCNDSDDSDSGTSGTSGTSGGIAGGEAQSPGRADRKRHGRMRYQAIIRLDLQALHRGHAEGDELCEITGLGPIPVRQARQLLGESVLHLVLTNGVDVQNVTYVGRGTSAAQKIALLWTQPHCSNIACPNTMLLEDDHRDPHHRVRCTELANIDLLCDHCHDLKTYKDWALITGTGRRQFVPPGHPDHPTNPSPTRRPPTEPPLFADTS